MRTHRRVGVTVLVVLVAAAAVMLLPDRSIDSSTVAIESTDVSAPGTAGMRAYLDPETGELAVGVVPQGALELDADTQNALRRDSEGLNFVRHANGAVSVDLEGRYQSVSMVRIDENGKAVICTHDAATAEKLLNEPVSTTNTPEVK